VPSHDFESGDVHPFYPRTYLFVFFVLFDLKMVKCIIVVEEKLPTLPARLRTTVNTFDKVGARMEWKIYPTRRTFLDLVDVPALPRPCFDIYAD
jgi:hypothetical protein